MPQGPPVRDKTVLKSSAALCHVVWSASWLALLEQRKLISCKSAVFYIQQSCKEEWCSLTLILSEQNSANSTIYGVCYNPIKCTTKFSTEKRETQIFFCLSLKADYWLTEMLACSPMSEFRLIFSGKRVVKKNKLCENWGHTCRLLWQEINDSHWIKMF